MNDKIKEIAIQAKIQMVSEPRLEEFSELLINDVISYLHRIGSIGILVERSLRNNYGIK